MASNSYTLLCVILQEPPKLPSVVEVVVPIDAKVLNLQKAIKRESEPELDQVAAHSLVLWKVNLS
jgi:hypothetical protein